MRRLLVLLLLLTASVVQAQDFSQVKVTVTPVAGSVYMLQGAGGNIGLSIGLDDAFVIDDQYAPLTARIKEAIATVTSKPVRFVINTHWHGDHSGGNENMAKDGAIIVAHDNVRRRMSTEQFLAAFNQKVPASPAGALPVVTFAEGVTFYQNGDTIDVAHIASAHTDGDVIITFRAANVVHMGDTYFNGFYPFIDLSSGGSIDGIVAAADRVLAAANTSTKIIPGHGPLGDRGTLKAYRDVMFGARAKVARLIAQKRTLAQIVAAKPLAEYDTVWGKGFLKPDQFVTLLHTSLTKRGTPKAGVPHH